MRRNRNAKIIATLGPASSSPEAIRALFLAGADLFRLNFSHGARDDHRARYNAIRGLEAETGRPVGILMDLQGPKLRVGDFEGGQVMLAAGRLKVVGRDFTGEYDVRGVRRSLRIANTPRWLYLPGGGACVTADNDAVDRMTVARRYERVLHRWESRPSLAAVAVAFVAAALWWMVDRGIPAGAALIAQQIPPAAEDPLGREALAGLDRVALRPSTLPLATQKRLGERFAAACRAAGDATPYRLEFRASPALGPNAFALPSGIIVMTDELVRLARNDQEVLGVLAHELGHVRHRHVMRRLLRSWPLPQQRNEAMNKRRVGLGFTGLGDALIELGLRYDADDGRALEMNRHARPTGGRVLSGDAANACVIIRCGRWLRRFCADPASIL